MNIDLYDHQISAVEKLRNGSILCGGVGTGKSRTALTYYFTKVCCGQIAVNGKGSWGDMTSPRDLYIITTAKKRDSLEWQDECLPFMLFADENGKPIPEDSTSNVKLTIDSWNNIKKYSDVYGAFFIFDEQRVVGKGAWVKAFLKIARKNKWILLSATPGDTWSDYIPVFVANGFYRNRTDFSSKHVMYRWTGKYYAVDKYVNTGILVKLRNAITVNMYYEKQTMPHHFTTIVEYDRPSYKRVAIDRWDIFDNEPISETSKLCYLMRKVINSDKRRAEAVGELMEKHPKSIVFYNFDYELYILRDVAKEHKMIIGEWNGQKHEEVPNGDRWVYLVQYMAGAEGWNCVTTDTMIFYSQNYSYRLTAQAEGRIDRLNTPFTELYYYHIRSNAPIDIAILRALRMKKNFNEKAFLGA